MKKSYMSQLIRLLNAKYPSTCQLIHSTPYELLFAVRLSAQCTDARVNLVTPILFSRFPTLEAIAQADVAEIQDIIRPCGFCMVKGADIKNSAIMIIEKFKGRVPDTMEKLLSLPGVGRKTANLIMGDVYGEPGIVADTHCIRIAGKLGLTKSTDPYKVEQDLLRAIPPEEQIGFCHRLVHFGRDICVARLPKCEQCFLQEFCKYYRHK